MSDDTIIEAIRLGSWVVLALSFGFFIYSFFTASFQ